MTARTCICGCHLEPTDLHTTCGWCRDPRNHPMIRALGSKYPGFYRLHVSPSQVATYKKRCKRCWAIDKIGKVPRGENRFASRGRGVHKHLEDWVQLAKPIDLKDPHGQIAFPATKFLPAPLTPGWVTEREIRWYPEGVGIGNLWVFQKDLEYPDPDITLIKDYKSFSREVFNLTEKDLRGTDPQGIVYAAHAFLEYRCRSVEEAWLYLSANKPYRCLPTEAVHDRDFCLERFAEIDAVATEMLDHRRAETDPQTFGPETKGCAMYGGCPYRDTQHCRISDEGYLMSQLQQQAQLVEPGDQLQNFLNQIGATSAPAPVIPAPVLPVIRPQTGQAPPGQAVVQSPYEQLRAAIYPTSVGQPTAPVIVQPTPEQEPPVQATLPALPSFLQPPAAPAPVQVACVPPMPTFQQLAAPVLSASAVATPMPVLVQPTPEQIVTQQAVAQAKRRRRTKAEMQAAEVQMPAGSLGAALSQIAETSPELVQEDVEEPQDVMAGTRRLADEQYQQQKEATQATATGLLERVALAMAANPGYCTLDSVAFADRAQALVAALGAL